jgi:hypothetical protein
MSELSSAKQLTRYKSKDLLYALSEKGPERESLLRTFGVKKEEQEIEKLFKEATKEMSGTKLITVSLKELKILRDHDWGSGEIYVVTTILDNSGQKEFKTPIFHGIKNGDLLPLGPGGMLVGIKSQDEAEDPGLFLDLHGVVMECDSDIRTLGDRIQKAKEKAKFDEIEEMAKNLAEFDPTKLTAIMNGVSIFLDVLVAIMQENKDDYVAQFHDFYLRQQAFGVGRHPEKGTYRWQDVELAYSIDMVGYQ